MTATTAGNEGDMGGIVVVVQDNPMLRDEG
jgi:hypothetical protein